MHDPRLLTSDLWQAENASKRQIVLYYDLVCP